VEKPAVELGSVASFVDQAQSSGRYTFSYDELERAVGGSPTRLRSGLRRLKEKGRIVSPRRAFYVIVPVEYRSTGSPPASWFINDLMSHLGHPYYVGLLSAAAIHGASHQRSMVFQVVSSEPLGAMASGRVRIEFFRKRNIERTATTRVKTDTGFMWVSTPEATVFDVLRHVEACGHLHNVATLFAELAEVVDPVKLVSAANLATIPEVQRAGYLFELVGAEVMGDALAEYLSDRRVRRVALRSDAPTDNSPVDERWRLVINESVEPDL
jgi:predicted transcriptional regulator of viral defense system